MSEASHDLIRLLNKPGGGDEGFSLLANKSVRMGWPQSGQMRLHRFDLVGKASLT